MERGWTLFLSGVPLGERQQAGVGIIVSSQFAAYTLGVLVVDGQVIFPCLWVEDLVRTIVCVYVPNYTTECTAWSHWVVCSRVLHMVALLSCWETSLLTWTMAAKHGGA